MPSIVLREKQNVSAMNTLFLLEFMPADSSSCRRKCADPIFRAVRGVPLRAKATEVLSQWSSVSSFIRKVSVYMHLH